MRRLLFAFLTLSLLFAASETDALIFGEDHRMIVSTEPGSLFGPVGIVYGAGNGEYATAFLIDDCHALTVQHVFGEQQSAQGRQAVFAANVEGPPGSWATSKAIVLVDGAIENNKAAAIGARTNDWALLRLSKCLGKKFGHVRLSPRLPAADPDPIGIAGYPDDRPLSEGLSIDVGCHTRGRRSFTLFHDCAALPGNSGSPLFKVTDTEGRPTLEVFAISEAAHSKSDLGRNVMEARTNYPDAVWNIATDLCDNPSLATAGVRCLGQRATNS